jgi:adenylate cyclase
MSLLDMMLLEECTHHHSLHRTPSSSCPNIHVMNLDEIIYAPKQTTEDATVLFIDIKGYTAICDQHTPGDIGRWIANFFNCTHHVASTMAVDIVETRGDCCICELHIGKHAERMLLFARTLHRALMDVYMPDGSTCTGVRMGMASGDVVVVSMGPTTRSLQGHTVNMAARMEAASEVGFVCVHASSLRELRTQQDDVAEFIRCKGLTESQLASDMACVSGVFQRPTSLLPGANVFCFEI